MLPEVMYHMHIVRKVIGTRRELWIAREVSCKTSGTVSVLLRLSNEKGPGYGVPDRVGEWLEWRQVAQTWEITNEKELNGWAIAVRSLHSTFGGPGGLCVKNGDLRGL